MPPLQQLERKMCDWIDGSREEVVPAADENTPEATDAFSQKESSKSTTYNEPHLIPYFKLRCAREAGGSEQDVWALVRVARTKEAAREALNEVITQPYLRWTDEDYRVFAEEDVLDPERARRLEAFLRAE